MKVVRDVILYTHVSFTQHFFSSHISHIHFRLRNNCIRKKNVFIYQQICVVDCCCYFSISIISFEVCLFVVAILMRTSNSDFFFLDEWICEFVYARIKLSKCLNMLMLSKQMCFDIWLRDMRTELNGEISSIDVVKGWWLNTNYLLSLPKKSHQTFMKQCPGIWRYHHRFPRINFTI